MGPAAWNNDDELDLRFAFGAAASLAGGQHSNLGPQLEALALGLRRVETTCTDPDGAAVARLDAIARASRVQRVLRGLDSAVVELLAAAFDDELAPAGIRGRFGNELAPVVMLLASKAEMRNPALHASIVERAETALGAAKQAYAARRTQRW